MAGYLGHALKAGVEGFQTGMNIAQKKTEMEWQKKQQKKLEEMEAKLTEEATLYNTVVTQAGADGFYSEDEIMKINTTYLALGYRTQESLKGAHDALLSMDKAAFDKEIGWFERTTELLKSGLLDPKDATAVFEYGRENWATSEKVQNLYEAADNIYAKSHGAMQEEKTWERVGKLPTEAKVPFLEREGVEMPEVAPEIKAPTVAEKKYDWAIENYRTGKISFDQLSKFMGTGGEVDSKSLTAKQQEVELMKQYGATTEQIKNKLLGVGEEKVAPEGEISAGEKRTFDMASSVMFGSSDWVTGISKPGIISMDISNKLNMGQTLTEEENTEVRNNYNAIKGTLPSEIQNVIESQLQRYGISLEAPPEPEVLLDIKKKSFLQSDKKYYGGLSVEELYQLADKEDDKKAYEELKKRGLIK